MYKDELSNFHSDDEKRTAVVLTSGSVFKVDFVNNETGSLFFKLYNTLQSAEDAAEDFVLYESS